MGYAEELADGTRFDTKPDSDDNRFDIMTIRLPHGGHPRPVKTYEAKMAGYRLIRFCCSYMTGWAQAAGKHGLATQLHRLAKATAREEEEWERKHG